MPHEPVTSEDADLVVLRVPADPGYARVVRLAVSAYAVRLRLVPAEIEDLRLAVDEALILLLGRRSDGRGPQAQAHSEPMVTLTLDAPGGHPPVLVGLRLDPTPTTGPDDPSALARFSELIPAGVGVRAVDATAGVVELQLPAE